MPEELHRHRAIAEPAGIPGCGLRPARRLHRVRHLRGDVPRRRHPGVAMSGDIRGTVPREFVKGNEAICHGALAAGCRHYFGYPITPQNDIPEYMAAHMASNGGVYLQAESEVATINMMLGTAATGKRVMTSSSGPGISLMQE